MNGEFSSPSILSPYKPDVGGRGDFSRNLNLFFRRALSSTIDLFVMIILFVSTLGLLSIKFPLDGVHVFYCYLAAAFVSITYIVFFPRIGNTAGKAVLGLSLEDQITGDRPGVMGLLFRGLSMILLPLNALLLPFSRYGRHLGDHLAATDVVFENRSRSFLWGILLLCILMPFSMAFSVKILKGSLKKEAAYSLALKGATDFVDKESFTEFIEKDPVGMKIVQNDYLIVFPSTSRYVMAHLKRKDGKWKMSEVDWVDETIAMEYAGVQISHIPKVISDKSLIDSLKIAAHYVEDKVSHPDSVFYKAARKISSLARDKKQ